jgi:hypothetical protein
MTTPPHSLLLASLLALAFPSLDGLQAQEAPARMVKIVSRELGPPANSFAAQPRVIYRSGKKYARLEEPFDPEDGIHALTVGDEPDSWMINLADNTGRHLVDRGPTFNVSIPIFLTPAANGREVPEEDFKALEFGNEAQYFREHNARDAGKREVDGRSCRALVLKRGAIEATLLLDEKTGKPFQLDEVKNGRTELSLRYLAYEDLPFRKALFEPPKNVKMMEAQ